MRSTTQVYRVSNQPALPLHWCYCEAWELGQNPVTGEVVWKDNRGIGAQVWEEITDVICATFSHTDGIYGPEDYSLLLLIDTPRVYARDPWNVIREATRLRSVSLVSLHEWLASQGVDDKDSAEAWLSDPSRTESLQNWLDHHATENPVEWYESLPEPSPLS